jgi:hypothetical protein
MRTNNLYADTAAVTRRLYSQCAELKKMPRKTGYALYSGINDFLKSYPVFSLNQYGEPVISGRRIC